MWKKNNLYQQCCQKLIGITPKSNILFIADWRQYTINKSKVTVFLARLLYSNIITESHLSWQNMEESWWFLTPHVLFDHTAKTDFIQILLQLERPIMCHTPCYTHYTCQFEQNWSRKTLTIKQGFCQKYKFTIDHLKCTITWRRHKSSSPAEGIWRQLEPRTHNSRQSHNHDITANLIVASALS